CDSIDGVDKVELWELNSHELVRQLPATRRDTLGVAISPDGLLLAAAEQVHHKVTIWNVYTGDELVSYMGHAQSVYQVAFAPDGRTLVSASKDGTLLFWRVPELEKLRKVAEPEKMNGCWEK